MVKRVSVPTFIGSLPDHYDDEDDNLDMMDVTTPARKREKPIQKVSAPAPAPPVIPPTRLQLGKVVSRNG